MDWLAENWLPLVIVILAVLAFIAWVIYLVKKRGIKEIALEAILFVEEKYNTATGKEKMAQAVDYVYELLPAYIKILLTKELMKKALERVIQRVFDEVKNALDFVPMAVRKELKGGKK